MNKLVKTSSGFFEETIKKRETEVAKLLAQTKHQKIQVQVIFAVLNYTFLYIPVGISYEKLIFFWFVPLHSNCLLFCLNERNHLVLSFKWVYPGLRIVPFVIAQLIELTEEL